MVKREVFEKIGRFSSEYFMYAEEMDLCYKINRMGWKVCYVGDVEIIHFGGQSTKKQTDGFSEVMMRESVFKFLSKFRGNAYAWAYRVALLLSAIARLIILTQLRALSNTMTDADAARISFHKWRKIASWALGMEGWTRKVNKIHSLQIKN